jgi:hypothetical protein
MIMLIEDDQGQEHSFSMEEEQARLVREVFTTVQYKQMSKKDLRLSERGWDLPRTPRWSKYTFVEDDAYQTKRGEVSEKKRRFEEKQMVEQRAAEAKAKEAFRNGQMGRRKAYRPVDHTVTHGKDELGRNVHINPDGSTSPMYNQR